MGINLKATFGAALLSVASLVGASTVGSVAAAQPQIANPNQVLPNVGFQYIVPVLQEAGFNVQQVNLDNQTVLRVQSGNSVVIMYRRACQQNADCAGLWMLAFLNEGRPLPLLNRFNTVSKPARASILNGNVVLDRYLIADYGVTKGSFLVNVGVFFSMIDQWRQFAQNEGPVAVSFEPLAAAATSSSVTSSHEEQDLFRNISYDPSLWNFLDDESGHVNRRD